MNQKADWGQVAMPGDAKVRNRQMMLRVIRSGKPLTAAEIHRITGISRPTVMRFLQHLCQLGVIRSMGFGASTKAGGKKPEVFCFDDQRQILCINLWPESITAALSGLVGAVYELEGIEHHFSDNLDADLADVKTFAEQYLARHGMSFDTLYGVVLTVPGTVDYATKSLRYNSQSPGWGTEVNLGQKLCSMLGEHLKCYIDNAGKAAGRALLLENPEYTSRRLMTFFTTWGVSACLMDKGHVHSGRDSLIGEIGHMIICDTDEVVCGCGKRGCLESMVNLGRVRQKMAELGCDEAVCRELTFQSLFQRSSEGDAIARQVTEYLAHCFAVALQNLSLAYNQESVIFQGDFAWADEYFDECLKQELNQFRYFPRGNLFAISYDKRDLTYLAAQGGAGKLIEAYFNALAEE